MQIVAVDVLGPLPENTAGNLYILVAGDYFTKCLEAYAISNQEAITVAPKLVDQLFCHFYLPEQFHSEQGKHLTMQEVCKILRIKKSWTSPSYHPQSDGLAQRSNRTLLNMLATTTQNHPFDWKDQLPNCLQYKCSFYTPFYLMFGHQARLPIDITYGTAADHCYIIDRL